MKNLKEYAVFVGLLAGALLLMAQAPVQLCVPTKTGTGGNCSFGLNFSAKTALTNTVLTVKSSNGVLGSWHCYNPSNAAAFVQVFNVTGTVTLGTTVPDLSFGMATLTNGGLEFTNGVVFSNAIKVAATTTATGSTAPSAALVCNFGYK